MARTKKQTIDAATERKRQFQEEIHNQTHVENTKKGVTVDSSSSETSNAKPGKLRIRPSKLSDVVKEESSRMSTLPSKSANEFNILPQAVVRVTDICKSPADVRSEDSVRNIRDGSPRNRETRDISPRNRETRSSSPRNKDVKKDNISPKSKETRDTSPMNKEANSNTSRGQKDYPAKNIFEVMEMSPPKKRSPKKTSPSPKSKELEESLRALKSESERVRLEKSKKYSTEESPKLSPKPQSHGRRSPRNQSPSSSQSKIPSCPESPGGLERQKINIFTDDIGKDLGKRIRSPRRLSEDMIALPIFSLRAKAGQSPKESAAFSKYADDGSSVGFADSGNSSSNIFKSPHDVHLSPCRKMSTQKSSESTDTFLKQPNTVAGDTAGERICGSTKSLSSDMGDVSQTSTMSSICRDVVKEISSSRCDLFMTKEGKHNCGGGDCVDENKIEDECVKELDSFKSDEVLTNNQIGDGGGDASCVMSKQTDINMEEVKESNDCKTLDDGDDEQDGVEPSLLCAMLVGGTNVVEDYSQKRQRYNPEVTEISDSETEQSRTASPIPNVVQKEDKRMEVQEKNGGGDDSQITDDGHNNDVAMEVQKSEMSGADNQVVDDSVEKTAKDSENFDMVSDRSQIVDDELKDNSEKMMEVSDDSRLHSDGQGKPDVLKLEAKDEEGLKENDADASNLLACDDSKCWKKSKIEFSSQLKKVNDDILKLLDIDLEDQFMNVPDTEEIIKDTVTEKETKLYKLISNLCVSLKDKSNTCDSSDIDKIVQTCPKGSVHVVSSSFSDKKWQNILNRLKNEKTESKKSKHRLKRDHMDPDVEKLVEKLSASTLQSTNEESNDNLGSVPGDSHLSYSPSVKNECEEDKEMKTEIISSAENSEKCGEQNSCLLSASSSSLSGSLCELDLDSMTHAATQALKVSEVISDSVSEPGSNSMSIASEEKAPEEESSNLRITRRFQKSKTCGDLSQESPAPSPSSTKSGTLRRTNSSPQLLKSDSFVHSRSNSPCLGKDQQVKSKLGGKIPVPGTSYSFKNAKKTVRKPRVIMDTKPLDVLLQFVNDNKESKDIFCSQDLQRFLWMPSNRMIVTPAIHNEISKADKIAQEAWEKRLQLMQEDEERQRKKDEEIDTEYMKYEPGFDEVDGHLFMSFSSEAELLAHVRVEKALEWDKDDTMLRIARAKHFEETKAVNGDMKSVKMKRLRGQHMRWKKYKRLYGHEVETVLTAKEKNIPLEDIKILEKTSDASKIKGWKKKSNLSKPSAPETKENEIITVSYTPHIETPIFNSSLPSTPECTNSQNYEDMEECNFDRKDASSKSRRQFNFSDRKAHKQLFKELNMDWEDRMIHRKLGGWSLKGNRPKEFSQAAKKREQKEIKALGLGVPSTRPHRGRPADAYTEPLSRRRRVVFPLITERMAFTCLQTLELSDDLCQAARNLRRKKKKELKNTNRSFNSQVSFPPYILPTVASLTSTPQSSVATAGSVEKVMDVSTPEASVSMSESTINTTSPSLSLDLPEDTVMEGVEIVSHASSPSVAESGTALNSPQVKSCSKPGCRYGCICHLLQSPVSKAPTQDCNKEYCRLGCICDSLHSEQPAPNHQSHCGKPSCMLECCCSPDSAGLRGAAGGSVEDNGDIHYHYLKQRPSRVGERFSNLPRREKTHRSAKNVDAITRKAMMLYETSEIYCEKVERVTKKKSESLSSPPTSLVSCPSSAAPSYVPQPFLPLNNTARTSTVSLCHRQSEPLNAELSEPPIASSTVAFNAVNLVTSEVATVTASHFPSSRSQLFPWKSRRLQGDVKVDIEMDEVRQTIPVVEPSTHRRKRKSHPLSDEIFSFSSCARIQPYAWSKDRAAKLKTNVDLIEYQARNFTLPPTSTSASPSPTFPNDSPPIFSGNGSGNQEMNLKISGVCTLVEEERKDDGHAPSNRSKMDNTNAVVDLTVSKSPPETDYATSNSAPGSKLKSSTSVKQDSSSSSKRNHIHSRELNRLDSKAHQQGWHTSMVCLKARAPPKTNTNTADEDDIQEEDEVKLLEFAANCNWDLAKKEILSRVASCLLRGQYPQPRLMSVMDYVVEILPKAKQPSLIPPTLRVKLPGQMYSIRVRITKRDNGGGGYCDAPVIDLSQPSPVKETDQKGQSNENNSGVKKNLSDNLSCVSTVSPSLPTSLPSSSSPSKINLATLSSSAAPSSSSSSLCSSKQAVLDSSFRSSIGISGLNRIYNVNPKISTTQQNTNTQQSKSTPSSRRSSTENSKEVKSTVSFDDNQIPLVTAATKPLIDSSKVQIASRPNPTCASTLNSSVTTSSRLPENSLTIINDVSNSSVSTSNKLSGSSVTTPNISPVILGPISIKSPTPIGVTPNPSAMPSNVVNSTRDSVLVSHSTLPKSSMARTTNSSMHHPNQSSISSPMPKALSSLPSINLNKKVGSTAATSLLNPDVALRKERPSLKVPSFAVATPGKAAISPTPPVNELKYVQMLYEVEGQNEKKKTLIAVPISLTGASVDGKTQPALSSMPILTVPKPGMQSKTLPITIAPRNKAKLPQVIPGAPIIMKLPQMNSTTKAVQLIPIPPMPSLLTNSSMTTKLTAVISSVSVTSSMDSSIKTINEIKVHPISSVCNSEQSNSGKSDTTVTQEGTWVTQSRDRPIPSTEVSPPREMIPSSSSSSSPSSSVVTCSSVTQSNGMTESTRVLSGENGNDKVERGNKGVEDQKKTCENSAEPVHVSSNASVTVDQNTSVVAVREVGGPPSSDSVLSQAESQTAALNELNNKHLASCKDESLVVEFNTPLITIDEKAIKTCDAHSSGTQASQVEYTSTSMSESHPTLGHTAIHQENGPNANQSIGNSGNVYEIVDMDDLLVTCSSDVITTEEFIGNPASNLSILAEHNEQDQQPKASSSGSRKRKMSPELSEDVDYPLGSKKPRAITEISAILDEDSNLSSLITTSPQSFTSLQKSAFSSGRSSGSMEDVISSDEEIDVGEDLTSYQNRVEKAWENDHSSMISKAPPKISPKGMMKHSRKRETQPESKGKVEYHNLLERNRRAKLKELFDNLGNTILSVGVVKRPATSKDVKDADGAYVMPKATILTEAKSTIFRLNEKERLGIQEIQRLNVQNEMLFRQLKELKAQLLTNNMSGHAIINEVSRKKETDAWMSNEEEVSDSEIIVEIEDLTESSASTTCASADVLVKAPAVCGDTVDNLVCTEEPVVEYEMEFHPL